MTEHKKKIFFLIDKLAPGRGGATTHLLGLIHALKEDYQIFICGLGGKSEGPVIDKLKEMGIPVYVWGVDKLYGLRAMGKFFGLVRLFKTLHPDIVHTYLFSANIFGILAAVLAGVPVRISSRREVGTWKGAPHIVAERVISRLCDTILVPSNAIKDFAVRHEHVPAHKFTVIHNGIKEDRFNADAEESEIKTELGISSRDLVIGSIANTIPVKDHDTLFQVADRITDRFPDAKFILIGGGKLLEHFRQKAKEKGKDDRIKYLGYRIDVEKILPLFDVYICTSLMEGFSNSILEAMAAGKPVVATKVGGNCESVKDGENGLLVAPKDVDAFTEQISRLLTDRSLRQDMGRKAKEIFDQQFTLTRMVGRFKHMYSNLLSGKVVHHLRGGAIDAPAGCRGHG